MAQVDLDGRMVDKYEADGEINQQQMPPQPQQQQQILLQPRKSKVVADARKSPSIWATGMA
jgi:hypothetical protein